ncbi:MAG: MurR/RpiR family transcriptional regulator [Erysipelotrichaceae bacterium]|nr:MurR/RpiR family transcriptional regulator [Erysipelotrichaceae bacterium]MDD3809076.1 MurR/RpiR family transcriptional regulator [Erysipelotrichaceae bacterium]
MSLISQLEFELNFTQSEISLAKFILEDPEAILDLSIQQLAGLTYCSPATIVRFTHKLGVLGYGDFKIQLAKELQYNNKQRVDVNYPFNEDDNLKTVIKNLATLYQETIDDTINLIDYSNIQKVADRLMAVENIFVIGEGNSLTAALEFQHKMARIGKNIHVRPISGEDTFMLHVIKKPDVVIMISYSGETGHIINMAKILKSHQIEIIAITSIGENQLSKYATMIINVASREKIFDKIAPFASKTSISFVLDILFSLYFKQNYDYYREFRLSHDKKYDLRHPLNSPIDK